MAIFLDRPLTFNTTTSVAYPPPLEATVQKIKTDCFKISFPIKGKHHPIIEIKYLTKKLNVEVVAIEEHSTDTTICVLVEYEVKDKKENEVFLEGLTMLIKEINKKHV